MSSGNGRVPGNSVRSSVIDERPAAGRPTAGLAASDEGDRIDAGLGAALLPARSKARRRPLLFAAMVGLVCLGALVSVWAYRSASTTEQVVGVRTTVMRGEVISAADLMTVTVSVDPALHTVGEAEERNVVGQRAALDLAAGSLLTKDSVTDAVLPTAGNSIVGVTLAPGMLPEEQLVQGDTVRLVTTPGTDGNPATVVDPSTLTATVIGSDLDPQTGNTVVDVTLPSDQAALLSARAATGKVSLVLDSRERSDQ